MPRKLHHCFCNICKGKAQLTRYKIESHEKAYGPWVPAGEGSVAKKSKLDVHSSSDSSQPSSDSSDSSEEFHAGQLPTETEGGDVEDADCVSQLLCV